MNGGTGFVGGALRWWWSALASIIERTPDPFARGSLRLRPQGNGFALVGPDGAARQHLATAAPSPAAMKAIRRARRRYLDLDDEMVLAVKATLPSAARTHLREAIALRMPELTPFEEDEVKFDVAEPERHGPGTISVGAVIAPKRAIAERLEELSQLGVRVDGVIASEIAETTGTGVADFSPEISRTRARRLGISLALACAVLAASLVWLAQVATERQQRIRGNLEAALSVALENVREAKALEAEIEELRAALSLPYARRASQVSDLEVLNAIATVLPDDAYLTGFQRDGEAVTMTGLAADASSLIRPFEQLPVLSKVESSAGIARDTRLNKDRFSISARIPEQEAGQ